MRGIQEVIEMVESKEDPAAIAHALTVIDQELKAVFDLARAAAEHIIETSMLLGLGESGTFGQIEGAIRDLKGGALQ